MLILLSNDDGLYAPGIQAMRQALEGATGVEVVLCAPDRERSASGHSITVSQPLFADRIDIPGSQSVCWAVSGTPADAVKLGVEKLLPRRPDLLVSGINRGANLGTDVIYSGTVSAAVEGSILGIPSIAVSLCTLRDPDFSYAAEFARGLALQVAREGLPQGTILNVNVPKGTREQIKGVAITRQGIRMYDGEFMEYTDPRGRTFWWLGGNPLADQPNPPDSDVKAVDAGMVSVTPLQLNLTDATQLERLRSWQLSQ